MNIYDETTHLLESDPRCRERRNKDRAVRKLLCDHFPALKTVDKEVLIEALGAYNSYDRAWRKVLEEKPLLRGTDYFEKAKLEQKKQLELGYSVKRKV
jgi:hypothetical protein